MTLTEFLLARIAEDETVARKVLDAPSVWARTDEGPLWFCDEQSDHVAMAPARVLAECEAKRRVVAAALGWHHETVEDCWYSCAATYGTEVENACCDDGRAEMGCDCGRDFQVQSILAPLAAVYADHPDYDPAWRVA